MIVFVFMLLVIAGISAVYLLQEKQLKKERTLDEDREWLNKIYNMPSARNK